MKKKTIIGLIGEQASGKGAAANIIIKKYGGTRLTISNVLRRTLDNLYVDSTRSNLIKLAIILKKTFQNDILINAILREAEKIESDLIIVDGIRMPGDIEPFIKEYDGSFHLIYVTAEPDIRYERSRKRAEKVGEATATYEEFLAKEQAETEKYIAKVGRKANFKIINNGSDKELEAAILEVMAKI